MVKQKTKYGSKTMTQICTGCHNKMPKDSVHKTCKKCRERAAKVRANKKLTTKKCAAIKQGNIKCTNKVSPKCGNEFCMKHKNQWIQKNDKKGVRRCNSRTQCNPGSKEKAILPDGYKFMKCENCLERERKKDKERRDAVKKINNENHKYCYVCRAEIPPDQVVKTKKGDISVKCHECLEKSRKQEEKRDRSDRDYKSYESRPEVKQKRKEWREENPDKTYDYYTSHRGKKLKEDPIAYRKRNAKNQRKHRKKNPHKFREATDRFRTLPDSKITCYKKRADEHGYDFDLTNEEFRELVESDCYYCGCKRGKILNGIDRLDNSIGYTKENTVPACKMCNNMKNTLNESTFILMCMHIATVNKIFKTILAWHVFNNHQSCSYNTYKKRANQKNIEFDLEKEHFEFIKQQDCYICGKKYTDNHCNGIDRFNNNIGYIIDNCKSCCADCNYLKKDYKHDDILFRTGFIAHQHKHRVNELLESWVPSSFREKNVNKLSKEECNKLRAMKREARFKKTLESKTPVAIEKRKREIREEKMKNKVIKGIDNDMEVLKEFDK